MSIYGPARDRRSWGRSEGNLAHPATGFAGNHKKNAPPADPAVTSRRHQNLPERKVMAVILTRARTRRRH